MAKKGHGGGLKPTDRPGMAGKGDHMIHGKGGPMECPVDSARMKGPHAAKKSGNGKY